jgi:UDP-N-acetylglucosamine---dolichyl-phosphate N-acetylglucosaminyltransferase
MKKTFAIIPAYNESKHIRQTAKDVAKYVDEVIVVDDGSKDKTFEEAKKAKVKVLRLIVNMGKGVAMNTGIEYAISKKAKEIVLIDADGQHDASEIPKLLKLLRKNKTDVVLGIRQMPKNSPLLFKLGNWGLNQLFFIMFGSKIDDTQNGFRALRAKIYPKIKWNSHRYFVETEMIINIIKNKLNYTEVPITTHYHDNYKGTTVLTGLRYFINMIEVKLKWL